MTRVVRSVALGVLVLAGSVGCRTMTGQSAGTNIDNTTTTATVKAKLAADRLHNLTWVGVDTNEGVVYLTGTASSQTEKDRATEIARSVDGVKKVVNNLQVKSASATSATPSASPATRDVEGRHTVTGDVVSVDHGNGHLTLRTGEGNLMLPFPPAAVANVKPGDRVTVDLGIRPAR